MNEISSISLFKKRKFNDNNRIILKNRRMEMVIMKSKITTNGIIGGIIVLIGLVILFNIGFEKCKNFIKFANEGIEKNDTLKKWYKEN